MDAIYNRIVDVLGSRWHKRELEWLFPLIVALVVLISINVARSDGLTSSSLILAFLAAVIAWVCWRLTNRLPRNPSDSVGVGILLRCDNDAHEKRIRADFIEHLEELLILSNSKLRLLVLPSWALESINDQQEINDLAVRTSCHFLITGRVRERVYQNNSCHLIDVRYLVRHRPIGLDVQKRIEADFVQVAPQRIAVNKENEIFNFEATSTLVDLGTRYIIALAAYVSGDLQYAELLLLKLESELLKLKPTSEFTTALSTLVPQRLVEIYDVWAAHLSTAYFLARRESDISKLDEVSKKLLNRQPRHYGALLNQAMCAFLIIRDLKKARDFIRRATNRSDLTWLYGRAFLLAYENRLEEACNAYMKAFEGPISSLNVPIQCEEFISIVLDSEPDKIQLRLCLALINSYAKQDHFAAIKDAESFLNDAPNSTPAKCIEKAKEIIERGKAAAKSEQSHSRRAF